MITAVAKSIQGLHDMPIHESKLSSTFAWDANLVRRGQGASTTMFFNGIRDLVANHRRSAQTSTPVRVVGLISGAIKPMFTI